jgi:hypothetical protein
MIICIDGLKAGNRAEFKRHWGADANQNNATIQSWMAEDDQFLQIYFNNSYFHISNDVLNIVEIDELNNGWTNFFNALIHRYSGKRENRVLRLRERVNEIVRLLGGNKAYYIDDNNDNFEGIGNGNHWDKSWAEIEDEIENGSHKEYNVHLLPILFDPDYLCDIQERLKDDTDNYTKWKKFSVVIDDFV